MQVIKLSRRPGRAEFLELHEKRMPHGHRLSGHFLVSGPLDVPERKRTSEWLSHGEVHVWWVREFSPSAWPGLLPSGGSSAPSSSENDGP